MGPEMVRQFQEIIDALEADEHVRVVVFDSAVDDYFLNHADFTAKLEDLTSLPAGPTGLPPWPDFLVRLTRLPVASIALIRGRATGNGSEITLACDMSFASREKAIISQWEVGVGMVAGGGPMARLPQLIGRNRALEVLLSSEDIRGEQAEAYGYVNRALPDADLDAFVEALATRIAKFDKWAIANTKRLVNTSLPPDVELGAGWDACIASLGRPAAQNGIKAADGARLPQTRGCRKSARVLRGPNPALGQLRTRFPTPLGRGTAHQRGQCGQAGPIIGHIDQPEQPRILLCSWRHRGVAIEEDAMKNIAAPIPFAGSQIDQTRHVCAFFNSPDEEYRVLLPFIKDGFESGHKAIHLVNRDQRQDHLQRLTAAGIDTAITEQSGQLEIRTDTEIYLREGRFDADRMISAFEQLASGNGTGADSR